MTKWEYKRLKFKIWAHSVYGRFVPFIVEGQIIPYGLSYTHGYNFCIRLPLLLTWKQHSLYYQKDVWGSLHFLHDPQRNFNFFWCEHSEQPKVL